MIAHLHVEIRKKCQMYIRSCEKTWSALEVWPALYQEALREGIVLLEPVNDATLREVIRRHLDCHLVPYQDADSVLAQATGEVS